MAQANIKAVVHAPLTTVFDVITDHENFDQISAPVSDSTLEAPGTTDRNGLGAIRRLRFSGSWLVEKVVAWYPPRPEAADVGYDYKVIGSGLPIADHLGTIRLHPVDSSATQIEWTIDLKCPLWAGGEIAAWISCNSMERTITKGLQESFPIHLAAANISELH